MNEIALNLLESTVTLYPADATGAAILDSPIWTGVTVENLVAKERWIKIETRPTGAPYPKKHPLIQQYEISLARVWSLQVPTADGGFVANQGSYVLDIVWQDEDSNDWHRETFYNVTISDRERTSRDIDSGFTDGQVFDAEYMSPPSGGNGAVTDLVSGTVPMVIRHVSSAGTVDLYTYDPATHGFSESSTGISSGRASVGNSGTGVNQVFNVTFAGASNPALQVKADGGLKAAALATGAPNTAQVPRVEFWCGNRRAASLTQTGILFAPGFYNAVLAPGPSTFALYGGGIITVTIGAAGVETAAFEEN